MKKIINLFITTLLVCESSAQVSVQHITNIDSATHILKSSPDDTAKVRLLQRFFIYYNETKLDSALYYTQEALSISQKLNYEWGIGRCYGNISHINIGLGNLTTALEYGLKCLRVFEKINNKEELSISNNRLGRISRDLNNLQEAMAYFRKALAYDQYISDPSFKALHLTNVSTIFLKLNLPDSALAYSEEAYRLWRNAKNQLYMSLSLVGIAEAHSMLGNKNLAIEYCRMGIQKSIEVNNKNSIAINYFKLATIFSKNGELDSALLYAGKSLSLFQELNINAGVPEVALLLAQSYKQKGNLDSAYKFQELVIAIKENQSNDEKTTKIQTLKFEEKIRQQEIEATTLKEKEERKQNLQYASIALGLIVFVILFLLLSHSIVANPKIISFFGILALLIVFEFINLLFHPYLAKITHHSPLLMLAIMVSVAALLIPLHHKLEKWITKKLIEKNKKIRLAAAKKTIAKLEGEQTN